MSGGAAPPSSSPFAFGFFAAEETTTGAAGDDDDDDRRPSEEEICGDDGAPYPESTSATAAEAAAKAQDGGDESNVFAATSAKKKKKGFRWWGGDELLRKFDRLQRTDLYCDEVRVGSCAAAGRDDNEEQKALSSRSRSSDVRLRRVVNKRGDDQDDDADDDVAVVKTGVYEGGGQVWECSLDLLGYLLDFVSTLESDAAVSSTSEAATGDGIGVEGASALRRWLMSSSSNGNLLELGCGHALPTCYLLRERQRLVHLRKSDDDDSSCLNGKAVLVDYNESVVDRVAVPNLILNCCVFHEHESTTTTTPAELARNVVVGSGDWLDMSSQLLKLSSVTNQLEQGPEQYSLQKISSPYFDVILATETMYTLEAAKDTALLVHRHLSHNGTAFVATKRYYFGVGGGTQAFLDAVSELNRCSPDGATTATNDFGGRGSIPPLVVETVRVHDSGKGNIREVLQITRQAAAIA